MLKHLTLACALAVASLAIQPAVAAPITYTFSGIGSGTGSGGVPTFDNEAFTFTFTADTANIDASGPPFYSLHSVAGTFSQGAFTGTLDPVVTIVATADPIDRINFFDDNVDNGLGLQDGSLSAYDLSSSFGPLTVSDAGFLTPTFSPDPNPVGFTFTGGGSILITANTSLTFTASLDKAGVPEPFTLSLFGVGLAGMGALRRRKASI